MGDLVRIWKKIPHPHPCGAIAPARRNAPANTVVRTRLNVDLGDEMAVRGYHFLTRRKVYATTSVGKQVIPRLCWICRRS